MENISAAGKEIDKDLLNDFSPKTFHINISTKHKRIRRK